MKNLWCWLFGHKTKVCFVPWHSGSPVHSAARYFILCSRCWASKTENVG
jgi:hypothetical protein